MVTLNVHIEDKKSEKVIRAVLDALSVSYDVDQAGATRRKLSKSEKALYNRLSDSLEQVKLHQMGQLELRDASELLNEL